MDRTYVFESLPVRRAVLKQIIPAVASQLIAVVYNLADTYFVGLLNDPSQTAGVTVVSAFFILLTTVSSLFGVGAASVMARRLGAKRPEEARSASAIAFYLGIGAALIVSLVFAIFMRPILRLGGAIPETIDYAVGYAKWVIVIGGPFTICNTLLANLVRAEGRAGHASLGVSLGGIINIILDPFFVLPQFLNMGAAGAGLATALSNVLASAYFLILLTRPREDGIANINPRRLVDIKTLIRPILAVGFPSALQHGLTMVAVAAQARFVSAYGAEAVAALGIVKKLDLLPLYFAIGVANGLLPLLGYNYASGNAVRRRKAFAFGTSIAVGFALLCLIVYEFFAPQLAALFIRDGVTIEYAAAFLRRMVVAMPLMALNYPMIIQFQAMGKVKESLVTSILRKGVIDIPLLFLMDSLVPLYGCMWVQPIVDLAALLVAFAFYLRILKSESSERLK